MAVTRGAIAALIAPDLREVYFETGKDRPREYPIVFNVSDILLEKIKNMMFIE